MIDFASLPDTDKLLAKIIQDRPVFHLQESFPLLYSYLACQEPNFASYYEQLLTRYIGALRCDPFTGANLFRPVYHSRAFYCRNDKTTAVMAFKGTELAADDLPAALTRMASWRSPLAYSQLEHFVLVEQKLPMALSYRDALQEAKQSAEVQLAYLAEYKTLAPLPVPLAVYRWSPEYSDKLKRLLCPLLGSRALEISEDLFQHQLGAYVYWYPNPPIRVHHLDRLLGERGWNYSTRSQALAEFTDPRAVTNNWIKVICRILSLGFFPVRLSHIDLGQCIRAQNAVIDGGFVDASSLESMSVVHDDRLFNERFVLTIIELARTIRCFLTGSRPELAGPSPWRRSGPDPTEVLFYCQVWMGVTKGLAGLSASGKLLHPRLLQIVTADDPYDALDSFLKSFSRDN